MKKMKPQAVITNLLDQIRRIMPALQRDYSVQTLAVFGSYVRDEQSDISDLDLLVTFSE